MAEEFDAAEASAQLTAHPAAGGPLGPGDRDDYARMIEAVRGFLDRLPSALPSREVTRDVTSALTRWSDELDRCQVPEDRRLWGRFGDLLGRGQALSPWLDIRELDGLAMRGTVRFGRFFVGRGGVAHGGSIPLIFDEILGRVAATGANAPTRTAYLHVNFRSLTPIDHDLAVSARLVRQDGRKHVVAGTIHDGEVLCADAEGLFLAPK